MYVVNTSCTEFHRYIYNIVLRLSYSCINTWNLQDGLLCNLSPVVYAGIEISPRVPSFKRSLWMFNPTRYILCNIYYEEIFTSYARARIRVKDYNFARISVWTTQLWFMFYTIFTSIKISIAKLTPVDDDVSNIILWKSVKKLFDSLTWISQPAICNATRCANVPLKLESVNYIISNFLVTTRCNFYHQRTMRFINICA